MTARTETRWALQHRGGELLGELPPTVRIFESFMPPHDVIAGVFLCATRTDARKAAQMISRIVAGPIAGTGKVTAVRIPVTVGSAQNPSL